MMNTRDIISRIYEELDLNDLHEDARVQIMEKLGENILKKVTIAVLDHLPEGTRAEFEELSEGGNAQEMQNFMRKNIPEIDAIVGKEIQKNIEEFRLMKKDLLAK